MKKFYSVITTAGAKRLAAAAVSGEKLDIAEMAVGDGGGTLPIPDPNQANLIGEVYRARLNKLSVAAANVVEAEMIIPAQVGGWW
ncbi:phage tail protein, partial [Serratia marcescens]|nr:phage tail protein [Serratia marcescens]